MDTVLIPRPYQQAAIDSLFAYFTEHDGNPLVVMPTGSGKSIVQSEFIRVTLDAWPTERFLLLTHVKELIQQNASHIPGAAIYSAGLGKRETGQVTVAGIQSVYKKAHKMGNVSIVIIDEAHLVSKTATTMYRRFLKELETYCPNVRVIGLSATPYRLDSGPLHKGKLRIFTDIAYEVTLAELIKDDYLAPLVTAPSKVRADTSKVKKRGGEYVTGDLQTAMMESDLGAALDEAWALAGDRKAWLVFCVGVDHARQVCDAIAARGRSAKVVVGTTPAAERAATIDAFKTGELGALVSVGVLTTGFDAPNADALICLRPTMSPGLWVQMVGRVSRKAEGKTNGLVLDFTGNSQNHGPVDLITIDGDGNVKGEAFRICGECGSLMDPRQKVCDLCGWYQKRTCWNCKNDFDITLDACPDCREPVQRKPRVAKHADKAYAGTIVSDGGKVPVEVDGWRLHVHNKEGKPPSVRVEYYSSLKTYREWVCPEHQGYASQKAAMWWIRRGGKMPTPTTTARALERQYELSMPESIMVERDGKYWSVV